MPSAVGVAPAAGVLVSFVFGDASAVAVDCHGLTAVTLSGCHEPDTAVATLLDVPVHESHHPGAALS